MKTVAIVGGGIAGLATAYFLQSERRGDVRPVVLEHSSIWGGKVQTNQVDGFTIEGGPDSFLTQKPAALELCQALGLEDSLIRTNQAQRKLYILRQGKPVEAPAGLNLMVPTQWRPVLRSPLLSPWGKLRLALEPLVPRRPDDGDESMASFVRRRLGGEVLDRLASPLLAGVYAGDPEKLSIHATFRRFPDMERAQGSLLRAARQQQTNRAQAKWTPFVSLQGGMGQLTEALVAALDPASLRLNTSVVGLERAEDGGSYHLRLGGGERLTVDVVVLALPAFIAADLLAATAPLLAALLRQQRYVSSATVSLGYPRSAVAHPLDGFGLVIPPREGRDITACTWSSTKFPGRAPQDHVLLRCFIGRDGAEGLLEASDVGLVEIARRELRSILGITAPPLVTEVRRWPKGMPQYDVGHPDWVNRIEEAERRQPGLFLTGHAYRGIGVPDLVQDARRVAAAVSASLTQDQTPALPIAGPSESRRRGG